MSDVLSDVIQEAWKKFNKDLDDMTKAQFFDCLQEAIDSGDFLRACSPIESYFNDGSVYNSLDGVGEIKLSQVTGMTYLPYRERNRLETQLKETQDLLVKACGLIEDYCNLDADRFLDKPEIKAIIELNKGR